MESYIKNSYEDIITNERRAYSFSFEKREAKNEQILIMLETTSVAIDRWLITQIVGKEKLNKRIVKFSMNNLYKSYQDMKEGDHLNFSIYILNSFVKIDLYINSKNVINKEFKKESYEQT